MKSGTKDTLLLIGNKNSDRSELHAIFESQFYLLEAETATQGVLLLKQSSQCIAGVIADVPLSQETAIQELIEASNPGTENEIPVLLLINPTGIGQEERAFLLGATDVIRKPYAKLSIQRRVQTLVDLYMYRLNLEKMADSQNQVIRKSYQHILDTMSSIIEHPDTNASKHTLRIRGFTKILLEEVSRAYPEYDLTEENIDAISAAAALHDIGKIAIPQAILHKPGSLTPEEFEIMKTHTTLGSELITQLADAGETAYMHYAYNICLYHHERWDGSGYPKGLAGAEIPICAQVAGLADAFEALTASRVYQSAFSYQTAINMILNGECGTFSPQLLGCLKYCYQKLVHLASEFTDGKLSNDDFDSPLPTPEPTDFTLDATQIAQLKFQTLLHYLNDTVIEMDLDNHVYHVVNNPYPDFFQSMDHAQLDTHFQDTILNALHLDDRASAIEIQKDIVNKLFVERQRKYVFHCSLYNPPLDRFDPYEVTALRVNIGNPNQRVAIAVFRNLSVTPPTPPKAFLRFLESPVLYDLMSASLCCKLDSALTILDGSNMLLHLTGYSPWDLENQFGNSFLNMVEQQDRAYLQSMLELAEERTNRQEGVIHIQCKNDSFIMALCKCRVQTGSDGSQYLYLGLTDVSYLKISQHDDLRNLMRKQEIVQQFQHVILEWNLETDELSCSEQWKERFGFELDSKGFSKHMEKSSRVHPDDLLLLRSKVKTLRHKEGKEHVDLRIADSQGRYTWSRIRAVSKSENQNKPTHIIAVVYNIDDLKHDALALKQQAEQDALTKLLNKASAQQAVVDYLEHRKPGALDAMLILDLDNFKSVNDSYGHLYGDAVLTHVGNTLRSLFRSRDIIGRIGGDEFLILLKDLTNISVVHERCELLVTTFQKQLSNLMPELSVSTSVGAALAPEHGTTWADLFRHADEALYGAKNKGKSQYKIFNPQDSYQAFMNVAGHTRIDSDDQATPHEDTLVRQVFHNLYASTDLEASIKEVLTFVGTHFNVSRVYIFENNAENTHCKNTFEWCNAGIEPQIQNLTSVSYADDVPSWKSCFNDRGILYSSDIQSLAPDLRDILESQGIKSILHCAIMDQGVFRGVVGFDDCNSNHFWTREQISTLQFLAEVLSVFLLKRHK